MNAPKEMTILASCPFCGCAAAYYGAAVRCTSFKCNAGLSPDWSTKAVRSVQGNPDERLRQAQAETAERWNHRTSQAAPATPDALTEGWQPMDSAPTNGRHMILAIPTPGGFVRSIEGAFMESRWMNALDLDVQPLCWMPKKLIPDQFLPWTAEYANRDALISAPAQEGGEVPEHVGTCEACSKAIIDGEKYASTTDGCSLCFDCAPMLSDVVRQMDEALENGETENWFDLSEDELRADRESLAKDIATNGDRKAVH